MGAFGDLLFDLTGQVDPRRKMAQALAGAGQPSTAQPNLTGSVNPVNAAAGGTPQPDANNPPQPAAPPQPQAYTSAPDFSKMYLDLLNRQESSDAIDRGMGLLFAGFAQPQDRAGMVSAMSSGGSRADPATMISTLQNAQVQQGKIDARVQLLQNAPAIAQQLHVPIEQVIAAINSGAIDDLIKEHDKAGILQSSPLYGAQVSSAQTEADLHRAQIEKERADQALTEARTKGVPSEIAQREAEARAADARAAEAAANATKVPGEIDKNAAEAAAARARATNEPLTPDIKNYNNYVAQFNADPDNQGKKPMSFLEFQQQGGSGSRTKLFGQTHIQVRYGDDGKVLRNPDGSPQFDVVQLTDNPSVPPVKQPGLQARITKTETDTGTQYSVMTDQGPQVIDFVPKNVKEAAEQKASGEVTGKTQTEARLNLESKLGVIQDHIETLQAVIDDKNLGSRVGTLNPMRFLSPLSNADAVTQSKIDSAIGLNIAQVASTLRDAGISRPALQEVMAAVNAVNRLKFTNVSEADYRTAAQEAINKLKRAAAIAYDQSGVNRPDWLKDVNLETSAAPPKSGEPTLTAPVKKGHYDPKQKKIVYD